MTVNKTGVVLGLLFFSGLLDDIYGQRDLKDIPDPDPAVELATFTVAEGFEVNLYASDPMLAKPVHMNFDNRGRLWIASSEVYPQIKPGQKPTDKIIVLDDTDNDGVADKRTVFADGLLIPTGVLPDLDSCYVANSTELIYLQDTDNDGVSDRKSVVLSGFGTEDTHHLLHTLRWGHDGLIHMNQSIYIHSHVETPHGVRHLNAGGIWQFRPSTMELEVYCRGLVNSWGHHFDRWGQSFATDGAGGEGINYAFPNSVFVTAADAKRIVHGLNPGSPKHCGLEIISGNHLPESWRGNFITNDFRGNRVCRFVLSEDGSGYSSRQEVELIKSSHMAFRPIDVKMGPDGAIYIADWYNPIIQHGEVDFRDSRRDHVHGRIWRVTAKDRPLVERTNFPELSVEQLLEKLKVDEQWERLHAKLELRRRERGEVLTELEAWLMNLDADNANYQHQRLEALWLYQTLNEVNESLLGDLLKSKDHRVRAAAVRVCSQWNKRIANSEELLARAVSDEHPQVRLEAVSAFAKIPKLSSVSHAMKALDKPMDRFLEFAHWQLVQDLQDVWEPAVADGSYLFDNNPAWLNYMLNASGSVQLVDPLLAMVKTGKLPDDVVVHALDSIARFGKPEQLTEIFELAVDANANSADQRAGLLRALVQSSIQRKTKPSADLNRLLPLLSESDPDVVAAAATAAGQWQVKAAADRLIELAGGESERGLRVAVIKAIGSLRAQETLPALLDLYKTEKEASIRDEFFAAIFEVNADRAMNVAVDQLVAAESDFDPSDMVSKILSRKGTGAKLASRLKEKSIDPDVARRSIRAVKGSSQQSEALLAQLNMSGKLEEAGWKLDAETLNSLVGDVSDSGDPIRGEQVFRRNELQCLNCHAVGGAGGMVGPDLISVGASAPVDYLVESLIVPTAKVKEGYHGKLIETVQGKIISGIPIRRDDNSVTLRLADDSEVEIRSDDIVDETDARSLMPDGSVDTLTREELVDLVAFLSKLGKEESFSVGNARVARRWEKLLWTQEGHHRLNRTSIDTAASEDPALTWAPHYSFVSGELPVEALPKMIPHRNNPPKVFVRATLDVSTGGKVGVSFADIAGISLWIDGKPVKVEPRTEVELQSGSHNVTVAVNLDKRTKPIRVELFDVANSDARAAWKTGK